MESIETQTVEMNVGELIAELRKERGTDDECPREKQLLAAYLLSGVFGSEGPCSRIWH